MAILFIVLLDLLNKINLFYRGHPKRPTGPAVTIGDRKVAHGNNVRADQDVPSGDPAFRNGYGGDDHVIREEEIDEIGIHFVFIEIASLPYRPHHGTTAGLEIQAVDYRFRNYGVGSARVP